MEIGKKLICRTVKDNLVFKEDIYIKSKKHNFILTSCMTKEGIPELKKKIFESFDIARIYLKEPNKESSQKNLKSVSIGFLLSQMY